MSAEGARVDRISIAVRSLDAARVRFERHVGARFYPEGVVLEGCRWREAFIHPRDAFGILIFLGERTPVAR